MPAAPLINGEPGSPLLIVATSDDGPEIYPDIADLSRRVHILRSGAGLDCSQARCTTGGDPFPGVCIFTAAGKSGPARYLAFAAGPGARTPDELLTALHQTARAA